MVNVTQAPGGRVYRNYRWELKSSNTWCPRFPQDYLQVETSFVVPDGTWVMERLNFGIGPSWLIGIKPEELDDIQYTDKDGVQRTLHISDKPFGYIEVELDDVESFYPVAVRPTGRKRLICAQQIHKGEFGQTVPIKRLKYVRQAFEPNQRPSVHKARERRRSNFGWVRLADLAAAANLSPHDVIFGFWNFSGHRNSWIHNNNQEGGQLLDIVRAASEAQIEGATPAIFSLTRSEVSELLGGWHGHHFYIGDVWVRRGFAYTVLRLLALGVRPEVAQPA